MKWRCKLSHLKIIPAPVASLSINFLRHSDVGSYHKCVSLFYFFLLFFCFCSWSTHCDAIQFFFRTFLLHPSSSNEISWTIQKHCLQMVMILLLLLLRIIERRHQTMKKRPIIIKTVKCWMIQAMQILNQNQILTKMLMSKQMQNQFRMSQKLVSFG